MFKVLDRAAAAIEPMLRDSGRLLENEAAPAVYHTNDGVASIRFGGAEARLRHDTLSLIYETGENACFSCTDEDFLVEEATRCLLTGRTTPQYPQVSVWEITTLRSQGPPQIWMAVSV